MIERNAFPESPPNHWIWVLGLRSCLLRAFKDPMRLAGQAYAWALLPVLMWVARDRRDLSEKLRSHSLRTRDIGEIGSVALGVAARLELEGRGHLSTELRDRLTLFLGKLDDMLFVRTFRPFFLSVTVLFLLVLPEKDAVQGILLVTVILIYNMFTWTTRFAGVRWGWILGERIVYGLHLFPLERIILPMRWGGALVAGILLTAAAFGYHVTTEWTLHPEGILGALLAVAFGDKVHPMSGFLAAWGIGVIAMLT